MWLIFCSIVPQFAYQVSYCIAREDAPTEKQDQEHEAPRVVQAEEQDEVRDSGWGGHNVAEATPETVSSMKYFSLHYNTTKQNVPKCSPAYN